jgi:hypothetical protein
MNALIYNLVFIINNYLDHRLVAAPEKSQSQDDERNEC